MKILKSNRKLKKFLKKSWHREHLFLHDTGNMYGIGCAAFSKKSITKINDLKQRSGNKNYIVLIPKIHWLNRFGIAYQKILHRLFRQFWPGNLTILLEDAQKQFSHLSKSNKVGIRIPTSKLLRDFIEYVDEPIISTSVNISGKTSYTDVKEILKKKEDWFDFAILENSTMQSSQSTIIDYDNGMLNILREGSISIDTIEEALYRPLILFVCTGNICRSPMAEYYSKYLIDKENLSYRVGSAGFMAEGYPISKNAFEVLREEKIDGARHISRVLNKQLVESSNIILTMTAQHKFDLLELFPNCYNKVFTLSEFCGIASDIADPYGLDYQHYRNAFEKIKAMVDIIFRKLEMEVD